MPARRPAIVVTYPFPLGERASGGSRATLRVARHMARAGADVTIVSVSTNALDRRWPRAPVDRAALGLELDEELARDGVRIVRVDQNPLHYHLDGLGVRRAIGGLLAQGPVDAVLSYFHEAAFLPGFLRRRGVKFGFFAMWQTYSSLTRRLPGWRGRVRAWIDRRFVVRPHRAADVLFATSRFTRDELVEHAGVAPERIVLYELGVEPSFLEVPRERPSEIRHFLYFGRIIFLKGFLDALEALGELAARGRTDWTYRLFGTGRQDVARQAAERLGIADNVEIHPPVGDERLRAELAWAHVALMPSHFEAFGLSIAEAQAAGLPVIAYAVGSVPEVVADGSTGWLAPFREPSELARRIEDAVRDPEGTFAAGLAARERARELFSWDRTARTVLEGLGLASGAPPA